MSIKLTSLLSGKGFIMVNKDFARIVGLEPATIFGQLCASFESFKARGMLTVIDGKPFFYLTAEQVEHETTIPYKRQLKAFKTLEEKGYIQTARHGIPAKKFYHVTDKIERDIVAGFSSIAETETLATARDSEPETAEKPETASIAEMETLDIPNGKDKPGENGRTIKKNYKKELKKTDDDDLYNTRGQRRIEFFKTLPENMNALADFAAVYLTMNPEDISRMVHYLAYDTNWTGVYQEEDAMAALATMKHCKADPVHYFARSLENAELRRLAVQSAADMETRMQEERNQSARKPVIYDWLNIREDGEDGK